MTSTRRLEDLLTVLLRNGSWLASGIICIGLALAVIDTHLRIAALGIALFILLPTIRVLLMLFVFLRQRDFRYAFVAGIVLMMILLGAVVGLVAKHGARG